MKVSELKNIIKFATKQAQSTDDGTALTVPKLFPDWQSSGHSYKTGDRVMQDGVLYKVLQDHTSQDSWKPADAPSLFAKVLMDEAGGTVKEWVQPDSTNAYKTGDKVTYNGKTYQSTIDNNVWSPAAYPAGWKEI
ncbi:MAG: hypothetical protein PUE58_01985 [Lachnospiraceae bacterium]|nr:hypothetical protein [Lachnospiraceae bacterium]